MLKIRNFVKRRHVSGKRIGTDITKEMKDKLKKIKRRQLTLFLSESCSSEIEKCRERFNLEQFKLIKAHITLCREDEIEQLKQSAVDVFWRVFVARYGVVGVYQFQTARR